MGRQQRLGRQDGHHHVVNRGIDKRPVFRIDEDRVDFGQLIGEAHERTGVLVNAYCLMDNHYHLVLECPDGGLSTFMHHLSGQFARHWHLRHGGDGPVFTGRFKSRPILDEEYLVSAVRYVHRNPLAFMAPEELLRYRWSSLRAYAGFRREPVWLRCDVVRTWSGGTDSLLDSTTGDLRSVRSTVDVPSLLAAIDVVLDATVPDPSVARATTAIALLALDLLDPPNRSDLVAEIVPASAQAAQRASSRARQHAETNPALQLLAADALSLLGTRSSGAGSEMTGGTTVISDPAPDDRVTTAYGEVA